MASVGRALLIFALGVAIWGVVASLIGARRNRPELTESGRRAVYALAVLTTASFVILEVAFLRSDFHFVTVTSHSSTTTPLFYRFAAAWSSQEGSLLLWVWLLSMWSSLVLFLTRRRLRDVAPYATAVLCFFGAFFSALLVFEASPFDTTALAASEGVGLSPLLRHPSMMIHPPMLYSGYTLFTIPFAFAVGALIVRRVDAEWIAATRRFALAAWLFLGIGIVLGARWSYSELGWGGYWAWDPVENASLLPWLTGTAFLHSIMLQERRGMLKTWNTSLVLGTGTLAILGTFLVRSGILDSIHAFGASTLGTWFVALLAGLIIGSVFLVVSRRDALRSDHQIDSLFSREAVFLFNNLVLVALAFVVLFLTFFPLIAEALTGEKRAIGPPLFNKFTVPLALLLVLLSGIGPVIAWRRASWAATRRAFAWPAGAGLLVGLAGVPGGVWDRPYAALMFMFGAFVLVCVGQELVRGTRARQAMTGRGIGASLVTLIGRNRRRYGGYTVHVGMTLLFVGVAASSAFQHARDVRLRPGQTAVVNGYSYRYDRATTGIVTREGRLERLDFGAVVKVADKHGKRVATLYPTRGYYPGSAPFAPILAAFEGESTSEVGLDAGLRKDWWTAIQPDLTSLNTQIKDSNAVLVNAVKQVDAAGGQVDAARFGQLRYASFAKIQQHYLTTAPAATFRIIQSPLVSWIWIGALVVFGGGLLALWPAPDALRRRATAGYAGRVARELGRA
jgi:cytochrome c-type biogenesis protein CcmF